MQLLTLYLDKILPISRNARHVVKIGTVKKERKKKIHDTVTLKFKNVYLHMGSIKL